MSNRKEKHNNNDKLCYSCDTLLIDRSKLTLLSLNRRGYGSIFDSCNLTIQLCETCMKNEYVSWFNEKPEMFDHIEHYTYEDSIKNLINSFIIENQEYIMNGIDGWGMDRKDWIDMQCGNLSDEKYEEYGMYSPSQISAYEKRFLTCTHPINVTFDDDSKNCQCVFGALGQYNQKPSPNISNACFGCEHFKPRENPIKEMTVKEFNQYKQYYVSKLNYLSLKEFYE